MNKKEKSQKTKKSIIDATIKYLKKKTQKNFDIDEICKIAGITRGAFYYHFKTKQNLIFSLLMQFREEIKNLIIDNFNSNHINTFESISAIPESIRPAIKNAKDQLPLFIELYVNTVKNKNLKVRLTKSYNEMLTFYRNLIEDGIKRGLIKKVNPDIAAKVLYAIFFGAMLLYRIDPKNTDFVELIKNGIIYLFK